MFKCNLLAFSLVEILVGLIVISVALAAFAPVMNKRIKKNAVSATHKMSEKCTNLGFDSDCTLCYGANQCIVCIKGCSAGKNLDVKKCKCI